MRIVSGLLRNRSLISPQNSAVRPTSDKVRAAIFSTLMDDIEGATFLDLFAGTGAMGIEAYSRGARMVTFLDVDTKPLEANLKLLPKDKYHVIKGEVPKARINGSFDIIFIDPPYERFEPVNLLGWIKSNSLLAPNGIIAYEESARKKVDWAQTPYELTKSRRYGDTVVNYLQAGSDVDL